MRLLIAWILAILVSILIYCVFASLKSKKGIRRYVAFLVAALIHPILGNMIVILSTNELLSKIGYYIYFIGMNGVFLSLLYYTVKYCEVKVVGKKYLQFLTVLLAIDIVQLLLNPIFGHAFSLEQIVAYGKPYYIVNPHLGQTFHRIIDYFVLAIVLGIFIHKCLKSSKLYRQKYIYILLIMIITTVIETIFIFLRLPVDISMIGFALLGILIFYFSIVYVPIDLLTNMLLQASSNISDAMFFFDDKYRSIWVNSKALEIFGLENLDSDEEIAELIRQRFKNIQYIPGEWKICQRTDNGKCYELSRYFSHDRKGKIIGSYVCIRDITEEQKTILMERYNAVHDGLTNIFTKEFLFEEISRRLNNYPNGEYYTMFINVCNFKLVNDIYGQAFGDSVLIKVSKLLRELLRKTTAVYGRLNGDTFGVLIPIAEFDEDVWNSRLSNFNLKQGDFIRNILVQAGLYQIKDKSLPISLMFDRAHISLQLIKNDYNKHISYYTEEMFQKAIWNQQISQELPTAIENGELQSYLQPITDLSGNVVGAEALIRWNHHEYGLLSPISFIPVFENNGMIEMLDRYTWERIGELLNQWKDNNLFISVNISPKDFYFMNVETILKDIVKKYDIDPSRMRIEITETVMMTDQENRIQILNNLRNFGFIVEMDDFGSGYSSLNLLKDMPVDVLKIDMNFLRGNTKSREKAKTIVNNIIRLSTELHIDALTEGVETNYQFEKLRDMGCKFFQGYYFSRPIPIGEFEEKYLKEGVVNNGTIKV